MSTNIFDLHQKMTAHLFPAYSNTDERFLALALAGEVGELCNMIKKRWRDGANLAEECRDEIADIRVYLELLAKCFQVEGVKLDQRVQLKLEQGGRETQGADRGELREMKKDQFQSPTAPAAPPIDHPVCGDCGIVEPCDADCPNAQVIDQCASKSSVGLKPSKQTRRKRYSATGYPL